MSERTGAVGEVREAAPFDSRKVFLGVAGATATAIICFGLGRRLAGVTTPPRPAPGTALVGAGSPDSASGPGGAPLIGNRVQPLPSVNGSLPSRPPSAAGPAAGSLPGPAGYTGRVGPDPVRFGLPPVIDSRPPPRLPRPADLTAAAVGELQPIPGGFTEKPPSPGGQSPPAGPAAGQNNSGTREPDEPETGLIRIEQGNPAVGAAAGTGTGISVSAPASRREADRVSHWQVGRRLEGAAQAAMRLGDRANAGRLYQEAVDAYSQCIRAGEPEAEEARARMALCLQRLAGVR